MVRCKLENFSCLFPATGPIVPVELIVKPLDMQSAQNRFAPLAPASVDYPLTLFLVIALLVAVVAGAIWLLLRRKYRKLTPSFSQKPKRDPRIELEQTLANLENSTSDS